MGVIEAKALLFDMDGTLVDSSAIIDRAWKWWTGRHNIPLEPIMAVQQGRPNIEVLRQFGPPYIDIDTEAALFLKFEQEDTEGLISIAGAREAVATANQGLWAVVTSADRVLAETRLSACGFPLPDVLVSANDIRKGKPDPECYLQAAQKLGVSPADCVVFEDAPAGVAAGTAAGMTVVGLLTTLAKQDLGCFICIRDFMQIEIAKSESGFRCSVLNS